MSKRRFRRRRGGGGEAGNGELEDLPDELFLSIFSNLDAKQLCHCCQVSSRWYALATDDSLWRSLYERLLEEESVKLENTLYDQPYRLEMRRAELFAEDVDESTGEAKNFKLRYMMEAQHMREEELRLMKERHQQRIESWRQGSQTLTSSGAKHLTPVLFYGKGGNLEDIHFISNRHVFGYAAGFLVPLGSAYLFGLRSTLVASLLGVAVRYWTYDVYFDEHKKEPKPHRDRVRSTFNCAIFNVSLCAFTALLGLLVERNVFASVDQSLSGLNLWGRLGL